MRVTCPNCGGNHPKWECKAPATKSTAAPVLQTAKRVPKADKSVAARSTAIAPAVDAPPKRGRGRPPTGYDKKAADRERIAKRRAAQKGKPA